MITNTKVLFGAVLKALQADCICDIGSRDGDQSLLFRHLRPEACVLAFEANPFNFEAMARNSRLVAERISIFPLAVSDSRGVAAFHVADVDYSDPAANKGTSSLLVGDSVKVKNVVEVETRRIDEIVANECPHARTIGLWIDVEGAEFNVLNGMSGIRDKVAAVHVETARVPRWEGQRSLGDLVSLMAGYGFVLCGSNIGKHGTWGDVVFVSHSAIDYLSLRFTLCKLKAFAGKWIAVDHAAVFLKKYCPIAYQMLRKAYLKLGL
jgi:FkbM family methyltransferase